jgi:hypothetical protein
MRRTLPAFLAIVCLAGCGRAGNRWDEADASATGATPAGAAPAAATDGASIDDRHAARIMLFAPVEVGPLAAIYPEARLDFAHRMAEKVDVLMREYDARVGESLPDSGAARWDEGRLPATGGVHVVVLARILDLRLHKGQPGVVARPDQVEAFVEVRAVNVEGKTVWRKRAGAAVDAPTSPKTITAAARPESRAAYDALDAGLGALRGWLATQPDLSDRPQRAWEDTAPSAAAALIEVEIDSDPGRADVLIDGIYRGTTPQKLKLPPHALKVRIERQGFLPWEREVTPQAGMTIQPALQPVAAPASSAPPAVPAPVPAAPPSPATGMPVAPATPAD